MPDPTAGPMTLGSAAVVHTLYIGLYRRMTTKRAFRCEAAHTSSATEVLMSKPGAALLFQSRGRPDTILPSEPPAPEPRCRPRRRGSFLRDGTGPMRSACRHQ